ncbi:MAG: PilN domain-containing protein [Nitrospinaceae bacterium]|nr:PilN domain-containing protein [Nitrospinaceae bacterium]
MIRINLHDYRYELTKIEIQKRLIKCFVIIIAAIVLIVGSWLWEQIRLDSIKRETSKVQSEVAALQGQVKRVNAMKAKQNRMENIITRIEDLREQQLPAGRIISDLNIAIPEGLWLSSIVQKGSNGLRSMKVPVIMFDDPSKKKNKRKSRKKGLTPAKDFMEISGYALTEKEVLEYMKRLQQLSYYETTFLYRSSQLLLEGQSVYKFIIYCYMPGKKKAG